MKIEKKYFLSHFGHYLIRACCDICLVLVKWVTYVHSVCLLFRLLFSLCSAAEMADSRRFTNRLDQTKGSNRFMWTQQIIGKCTTDGAI